MIAEGWHNNMYARWSREGWEFWRKERLPKNVLWVETVNGKDVFHTKEELNQRKAEKNKLVLLNKRNSHRLRRCYVWVFYNDTPFFGGWYLYLKCISKDWGISWTKFDAKYLEKDNFFEIIQEIFPCETFPGEEFREQWFQAFHRKYKTSERRRKEAKAFCRCIVDDRGNLIDIIK
jgi:hypothetical protein